MIQILGPKEQRNCRAINTTTTAKGWSKELSPFILGPCFLYDNLTSKTMENGWQYAKVYPEFTKNNEPTKDYYQWARVGWSSEYACRYPMGRGRKPLYSIWKGEKLAYIDARKKIYIPLYAKAVMKTAAFNTLTDMYERNEDIVLWDIDGYDHNILNMTLDDVVNCETKTMGHAFVLAMCLDGSVQNYL